MKRTANLDNKKGDKANQVLLNNDLLGHPYINACSYVIILMDAYTALLMSSFFHVSLCFVTCPGRHCSLQAAATVSPTVRLLTLTYIGYSYSSV